MGHNLCRISLNFIQANEEYYEAKLSTARNFFKMAGNVYFFTKMTDETGTELLTARRIEHRTDGQLETDGIVK